MSRKNRSEHIRHPLFDQLEDKILLDGDLDPAFGTAGTTTVDFSPLYPDAPSGKATSVAIQQDGRILVGTLGPYLGFGSVLSRLNPNGSLDTSFGTNGLVKVAVSSLKAGFLIDSILPEPNGKIVITGKTMGPVDFAVIRLNQNGSLDTTFGTGGAIELGFASSSAQEPASAALQSDGKILLVGTVSISTQSSGDDFGIIRLNTNGSLDTSFNQTGRQQIPFDLVYAGDDEAQSIAVAPDGKIVIAGYVPFKANNGLTGSGLAVARLNPDGTLDTSLNSTGKQVIQSVPANGSVSVAVAGDGRIVLICDDPTSYKGTITVVRLSTAGNLDSSFNGTGVLFLNPSSIDSISYTGSSHSLMIQADGKPVFTFSARVQKNLPFQGSLDTDFAVARLTTNGTLDPTFNGSGIQTIPFDLDQGTYPLNTDKANALTIQPNGSIVVAGVVDVPPTTVTYGSSVGVIRLLASSGSGTGLQSTTTSLSSSSSSVQSGGTVTFTATVTPSTATGQVQFLDGTQVIGSSNLASGIASFTTTLSDGTHSLTASYLGSTSYATSTSAAVSVTVGNTSAIPTSVSLNASNASIQAGQTVTLNATVSPLLATGQVQFLDGATSIGVVNLQAGAALFNASGLAAGQHTLTAHYLGSSLYSPSTSSPVLVTVISAATSLALTLSSSTLAVGRPLVMTATIDSSSATGRVRFLDGQTLLGATRFVGGRASFTVASLKRGTHSIWAVYDGDSSTSRLQTPVQTVVVGSSKVKPPPKVQSVSLKRGAQPTVRIVFSQAINGDLAQDIRDYAIRTLGKKGRIIPILRASYAVAGRSVTLALQGRVLTRDTVRLTIDASRIVNVSGALLDGNGDGRGGDNYNRTIG